MTVAAIKLYEIYEGLKNRFLFDSDINSIHILLSLYDLEENISNIYPKYICLNNVKRKIKNILSYRSDSDLISKNIAYLLHEDINRIELCFYLEGYKNGYYDTKYVNLLEERALEIYNVKELYERRFLFHFNKSKVNNIKKSFLKEIDTLERKNKEINKLVNKFSSKVIRKKLANLDNILDKQLKLDFTPYDFNIKEERFNLSIDEVDKIYRGIVNLLIKDLKRIYKDSSWYALNDRVLKRYD